MKAFPLRDAIWRSPHQLSCACIHRSQYRSAACRKHVATVWRDLRLFKEVHAWRLECADHLSPDSTSNTAIFLSQMIFPSLIQKTNIRPSERSAASRNWRLNSSAIGIFPPTCSSLFVSQKTIALSLSEYPAIKVPSGLLASTLNRS